MIESSKRSQRQLRQQDMVPPERLATCCISVIGVGAIGRQVALQLAALGAPRLQLVDPDFVEEVNLGPQAYLEQDVGSPKVVATASMVSRLNADTVVETCQRRFSRTMDVGDVLFCCVDSIATRRLIFESTEPRGRLFVDGRMNGETLRVLAVDGDDGLGHTRYRSTLFSAAEAHRGSCTSRSTVYAANIAAGLMVHQFTRWLRRMPVEPDVVLNLLAAEWTVMTGPAEL